MNNPVSSRCAALKNKIFKASIPVGSKEEWSRGKKDAVTVEATIPVTLEG